MANDINDSTTGTILIVPEGGSCNITATAKDMDAVAIAEADLLTLTLTLYDEATNAVINSRNGQDIFDANGGTVDVDGTITMRLDAADNPFIGTREQEYHVARFTWTWSDGVATRTGIEEGRFRVQNLASVS